MDYDIVIFWLVFFSCLSALFVALTRFRSIAGGWIAVYLSILLAAVVGKLCHLSALVHVAAAMWLLLVLLPALIVRLYLRRFLQQRYSAARRLARVVSWFHPADGWRQQPEILRALELAQQGETTAALEILRRFQGVKSRIGFAAVINFYRLTNQWEELSSWLSQNQQAIRREPQFLYYLLRAKGETGDVRGMVELYDLHRQQVAKLIPATLRDSCRLVLFTFCGRRQAVELLFAGSLSVMPAPAREFWLATADLAAGNQEAAKRQFNQLLPAADPPLRLAIQRRLSHLSMRPPPLDAAAEQVVEEAARELGHDEKFSAQPSLFSREARATQILIILNVLVFLVEIGQGGATDLHTLYRLGAFFPPSVRAGEWWRLVTSLFLHYGWLHITMNMLALGFWGRSRSLHSGCAGISFFVFAFRHWFHGRGNVLPFGAK